MLCYTGFVRRNVGLIDTQIELYREGREDTILGMKQLQEIAYAMRDAVEDGDVDELGAMLRDAFVAKRRMNPHIAEHTPIEAMLSMAQAAGATGGKICGAGGGGYLLLYCRPSAHGLGAAGARASGGTVRAVRVPCRRGAGPFRGDEVWAPTARRGRRTEMTFDVEAARQDARRYLRATADTVGSSRTRAWTTSSPRPRSWWRRCSAGGKILICGNGGSAADAQHLATEFVSTLTTDNVRPSIPAIALTTDTSLLTAIANDFGTEGMFERQVESLGRQGDVLIAISTSGNSANVIRAAERARGFGLPVIALTGESGGVLAPLADAAVRVPSTVTAHIQECHLAVEQLLASLVEDALYPRSCTRSRSADEHRLTTGGRAMAKSKDRGAGTGGRDQKKKPQKTIKEKRAAKKTKGSSSGG